MTSSGRVRWRSSTGRQGMLLPTVHAARETPGALKRAGRSTEPPGGSVSPGAASRAPSPRATHAHERWRHSDDLDAGALRKLLEIEVEREAPDLRPAVRVAAVAVSPC